MRMKCILGMVLAVMVLSSGGCGYDYYELAEDFDDPVLAEHIAQLVSDEEQMAEIEMQNSGDDTGAILDQLSSYNKMMNDVILSIVKDIGDGSDEDDSDSSAGGGSTGDDGPVELF